jgi:hypothetical protein
MRSQEFAATAAITLAVAALSFTIAAGLSALASGESLSAGAAAPRLTKPIYCPDGENRQFSNIHHAWVCRTELAPRS